MKIKLIRASGNPVDPAQAEAYKVEWGNGFDDLCEKHGKFGPEINKALDEFEIELRDKYNDLTVIDIPFPKSKRAWIDVLSNYGNIMVTSCIEDSRHLRSGELLFVINDQEF